MNEDQEIHTSAKGWVDANRSRALIFRHYVSTAIAALVKHRKQRSVSDGAASGPILGHPRMMIAEGAVRSGRR